MARMFIPQGTIIDAKYRVDSLIGEGGMGVVLKAQHLVLDEPVAIKVLRPEMLEKDEVVQRFLREARSAAKLKGNNVARVIDVGTLPEGLPYIVMEYLEGADLGAILRAHGPQHFATVADLMLQACQGIAEAHAIGIVHRDIKAGNFFITEPRNQGPVLKVLDFGIATAPQGTSDLTSAESVMGTPAYMAPEQMRASRLVDARSDIWSIGVVLYELLEGARPFRTDVYSELVIRVAMEPPVPLARPGIPEGLAAIVYRCLEKSVERRFQSVAELAYELVPFASDPVVGRQGAENCARVLGMRVSSASLHSSPRLTPYDAVYPPTPTPWQPPHRASTPLPTQSSQPYLATPPPYAHTQAATILGQPTPLPSMRHETPSSISASVGQVLPPAPAEPRRWGAIIGIASVLGGGAIAAVIALSGPSEPSAPQPAAIPTAPAPTPSVIPAPAVAPAPTVAPAPPAAVAPPPAVPVAAPTATAVADPPPPQTAVTPKTPPTGRKTGTVRRPVVPKGKTDPKAGKGSAEPAAGSGSEPGGELFIKRQ